MLGPQLASGSDPSELAARRSLVWLPLWLPRPSALAWLIPCLQSAVSTCGAVPDLATDASGSVRETPRRTGGNGTLMARGQAAAARPSVIPRISRAVPGVNDRVPGRPARPDGPGPSGDLFVPNYRRGRVRGRMAQRSASADACPGWSPRVRLLYLAAVQNVSTSIEACVDAVSSGTKRVVRRGGPGRRRHAACLCRARYTSDSTTTATIAVTTAMPSTSSLKSGQPTRRSLIPSADQITERKAIETGALALPATTAWTRHFRSPAFLAVVGC